MIFVVFQFTGRAMTFISQFTVGEVKYPSQMCYVNDNLVTDRVTPETIRVYHEGTGSVLNEWNTCHIFPCLMEFQIEGKEHLLVGCMHCKVIRGYESPETSSSYKTLHRDIVPYVMCQGPNNTVLVLDEKNFIKQFRFSEGYLNLAYKLSLELESFENMCYCEKNGIIVAVHQNRKTVTGVALATGEVVWKHTEIKFGSPAKDLDYFRDVFTILGGRICISSLRELFVLDSKDGSIKYELFCLEGRGCISSIATCNNGFQQRFAIQHGEPFEVEQISVYYLWPKRCLPLQNIISDEEILEEGPIYYV